MTGEILTSIEITAEEVALFREFIVCHEVFKVLLDSGVFRIRNGKAVLNFDSEGTLTQVDLNVVGYKRGKALHIL